MTSQKAFSTQKQGMRKSEYWLLQDGATLTFFLAFCESGCCCNLKTNNVKNIIQKYTFLERKFHKESYYIVRFLDKNCIFEKSPKIIFGTNFWTKGKKIYFLTIIVKNLPKPSKYMCIGNVFSLFVSYLIFENLSPPPLKKWFGQKGFL